MGFESLQLLLTGGIFLIGFLSLIFGSFYLIINPLKDNQAKFNERLDNTDKKIEGLKKGQRAIEAKFEKTDEKLDKILGNQKERKMSAYEEFEKYSDEQFKKLFNKIIDLRKKACRKFADSLSDERDRAEAKEWAESWTLLDTSETAHKTGVKMGITNTHKRDQFFGDRFFKTQDKELASEYKKAFQTPIETLAKKV